MSQRRLLLCTDMDRTIIPNGTQSEHSDARKRFKAFCQHSDVALAYVTGRHKSSAQQAIKTYLLPEPDFVITDVGSKIHQVKEGQWSELLDLQQDIIKSWKGKSHAEIKAYLINIPGLLLQESHNQNTHKLSFYLPLYANTKIVMQTIEARLKEHDIEASVIWSIDELKKIGLVDVLPSNANKLHAIQLLQKKLNYKHHEIIFAGDSGNDMPVLVSNLKSILVDNASDEVKETALQQCLQKSHESSLYIAQAERYGMNANYSAGVLEGIGHYAPLFDVLIKES
ncbi:MAG: sucrose-6F-phosphate phosphohydrolase [Methylophagaceae bacterium]|jgi:sucrose-6F-phosphate phosphohydrolase